MKYSVAIVAAAAAVVTAEPRFLNSNFDVVPDEPFTLQFEGCEGGCDIILQNGPSDDLNDVQTLLEGVEGPEEEITLSPDFPKDTYNFKIVDSDGAENYSDQFEFDGEGEPATTTVEETSTTVVTSTSTEETTSAEETTSTEETTVTTPAPTTSEEPSSTQSDDATTTSDSEDEEATETDIPDAAGRLGASDVTVFAAVVAVLGYFL